MAPSGLESAACCMKHRRGSEFQLTWLSSFFLFYLVQSASHRTGCVFPLQLILSEKALTDSPKGGHIKVLGVWYHNPSRQSKINHHSSSLLIQFMNVNKVIVFTAY